MASILPRTLARSSLSARAVGLSLSSSSSAVVRPSSGLQPSSPVASSSRLFSSTAVDLAAGQGSKEVKIKKKSKGAQKFAKGGKKAAQEDEDDEDDDSPVVPKNARGRGESLDEHALIDNTAAKAEEKMEKVVAWFQEKFDEAVSRGRGKVNGAVLDNVKVVLPKTADDPGSEVPLIAVATVSTKANVLTVNVFDETHTKHVEKSIHAANLPGISPTKFDSRTIRITIPRPSAADRATLLKTFQAAGEQGKTNIRLARTNGLKALPKGEGHAAMQEITDKHVKEVETLLAKAKKELSN